MRGEILVRSGLCDNLIMRFAIACLCAAMLAGCHVEADFSDNLKTQTLEAEQYQDEIASIDRLLFRPSPLGDDGVRALGNLIEGLSKRVAAAEKTSKFLKLESLELQLLAKRAGRLSSSDTGAALQDNWMRIRSNLFDDRAWFVRSAADLDYAAHAVPDRSLTLHGRWQVTSMTANGKPREDPEISGSIWTFELPRLIIKDGAGKTTTYSCGVEDGYLALITPAGEEGWIKFDRDAEGLRLAFFDDLKGKPKSFDPQPGPLLVVVRLVELR